MKSVVMFLVFAFTGYAIFAGGAPGALLTNGDVEIKGVGSVYAARRVYVDLNEDVESRVVCQVFYRDEEEEKDPVDEFDVDLMDEWINDVLKDYLQCKCNDMPLEKLVEGCRAGGGLYEKLSAFSDCVTKLISMINEDEDAHRRVITVVAVTIKPVGEFAQLVSE